ncbi:MAG: FimV/HubP family polar landmark protein [Polaromonas sp.]
MNNPGRWRIGALASAIALLGSLASLEAHALALGRITVQSALGEPLRAEVDIADINANEASSLKAGVAPVDAFKAAGLEYNAVVAAGLDVKLQRRADGSAYLRLTSNRPVTEPFVDLILEASWASGRITRDYTMLLDPPNLRSRSASAVEPSAPVLSRPATPSAAPIARAKAPTYPQATAARPAPLAKAPEIKTSPAEKAAPGDKQLTVKAGDTAGKIADMSKPASVSLDQMLVALLRSNPDAFIGGNINRIKSGAVLDIPDAQAASAISPGEASRTIVAQSRDFNAFRRKLADSVSTTPVASADRQAGGKLEAKLEDRAPASATPDKLTLSKGAIQGKTATASEEKIAKDKEAKEASSRMAELSKNISDLNKLSAAPGAAPAITPAPSSGAGVSAPSSLTLPVPAPVVTASSALAASPAAASAGTTTAPTAPASAASDIAAPLAAASQPAAAASAAVAAAPVVVKKPLVTAPPLPEPGLMEQLLGNPLLLGAGGLLALLAGLGFSRYRTNKKRGQVDSSFLESRLQADSFFGASGGQRIDTNDRSITGSSLAYSPSQLDAAGDVDPVAEADVYLAYGRDLQAEEILKEALRTTPTRVAIHAKLLEIYAKRLDSKAFEGVATDAFKLTHGYGPEWAYITELGRALDSSNPMYQTGGGSVSTVQTKTDPDLNPVDKAEPLDLPVTAPTASHALDLDLDFSSDEVPAASIAPASISVLPPHAPQTANPSLAMQPALSLDDLDLDLDLELDSGHATAALPSVSSPAPASPLAKASSPEIDFLSEGLDFTPEPFTAPVPLADAKAPKAAVPTPADSSMLEFDMSSLSLDLGPTTQAPENALTASPEDPLEIKFLLAEEFRALGDADGARSLADEVLVKASGPLKVKAQAFLNALS